MRIKYNRVVCLLLAVLMAFGCLLELRVPAKAAYENTHQNTGNYRQDIINVALTQVGYKEGPGNSNGNDTKYGQWWGHNPMAWCAVFVSWCADQAGIPESIIKQSSFSNAKSFGFSSSFTAYQKTPQPGDLFFRDGNAHVGIVYKVDGNTFYTIEGNTWTSADPRHGVMIRQRDLYSSQYTFVSPNYGSSSGVVTSPAPTSCSHSYVKYAEETHPHKEYYKCSKCEYQYYTGTNKTLDNCRECKQANCDHQYSNWKKVDDTYHTATCPLCQKVGKEQHNWDNEVVITEATCIAPGLKKQTCKDCGHSKESEIPATNEHTYSQVQYIDSSNHRQVCEVCEKEEVAPHTLAENWSSSTKEHWNTCTECGGRLNIGSHILTGSCASECIVCELTPNTGHMISAKWSSNAKSHWHRCINCALVQDEKEHVYSAECDEDCDICGYKRYVNHTFGNARKSDATSHWQECTKCGQVKNRKNHVPGPAATETKAQYCTECNYEMAPIRQHTHKYTYHMDNATHWGVCSCGDQRPSQEHTWRMDTGTCEVCQMEHPAVETNPVVLGIKLPGAFKTQWMWTILLISFAALIIIVVLVILFGTIRRSVMAASAARLRREFDEEDGFDDNPDDYAEIPDDAPIMEE